MPEIAISHFRPSDSAPNNITDQKSHSGIQVSSWADGARYPIRVLAALTWLFWSSRLYVEIGTFPTAAFWSILFGLGAVLLLALYATMRADRSIAILDNILAYGTLLIGVIWVVALVYGNPNYGTDEAAFVQGAAQILLHGHDPYGANLGWALQHFAVQPNSYTYTTTGHLITQLNYPSLSFLPEVALLAIGITSQTTIWVCAFFLAASGLILIAVVPPVYRPLAALLLGFDSYFDAAASGLIFTEMMVFTIIAMVSWEQYLDRSRGWRGWASPVALGLAICVQQDSWFLVPCFLVAVYQEARLRNQDPWASAIRYVSIVGTVFVLVNAPFIIVNPDSWIHGILEPLTLSLMPLGQGLIGLTTYLGVGGGDLGLYSIASLLVLVALLLLIGFRYRRTRFLVPIAPAIVLWFSTRSLAQYVLIGAYALLAALCCWKREGITTSLEKGPKKTHRTVKHARANALAGIGGMSLFTAVLLGVTTAAAVGTVGIALASKAPLSITIDTYHSTGEEQTIDSLYLGVKNNSSVAKAPIFVVEDGPYVGTPWLLAGANKPIPPHGYRLVKILAPNTSVMPSLDSAFKVAGFTSAPTAVSTSASFLPSNDHTLLTPFGLSDSIPVGKTITMRVQVLNRLGSPVTSSGIEVQLGQEVYSPQGLFATENSINGQPDGESPVGSRTNNLGIATFHIRADQAGDAATTLQAWLGTGGATGYSNRVILWLGYPRIVRSGVDSAKILREFGSGNATVDAQLLRDQEAVLRGDGIAAPVELARAAMRSAENVATGRLQ